MHWVRSAAVCAAFAVGAVLLAGCGGGGGAGDVSGTVSYDGKPVENGAITFYPADGKGPTAGGTIANGKYSATKVPVGKAKVVITGSKVVGKKKLYDTPDSPTGDITAEILPAKYSDPLKTELTFDVQSGKNEKNWDLPK